MKRFIAFCLVLLCFLPMLAACHEKKAGKAFKLPDGLDPDRQYEISFWAKNDTNINQVNVYKQAIEDFQTYYPNIKVNLKLYSDYTQIYRDVITNISTQTTPNVCITYPDHIATYKTGDNVIAPLDDLIHDPKYGLGGSEVRFDGPSQDEMISRFLNECYIDGVCYAVPFMRSSEMCYVNKDYVEKLGYTLPDVLTWDFVFEVSEAAMAKNEDGTFKVNGQKVMIPFIYKSTDNMMISMLKQLDAPYSTAKGDIELFNEETRKILLEISEHAATGSFSTFKISSYPGNFLNCGQCIFAIDSTAGSTWMGSQAPLLDVHKEEVVEFETAIRLIPQFDPDHPKMISQGPSICIFNKPDSEEVLASWLFTQYLLTNKVQIGYSMTEGYIPVTLKAQQSAEYLDYLSRAGEDNKTYYSVKIDATKLFVDHIEDTFVTPVFNGSTSVREAAGQMIEEVTKSRRRKETVDDNYIDNLYIKMTQMYHLDQYGKLDMGPLPSPAVAILVALGTVWILIGGFFTFRIIKKYRKAKQPSGKDRTTG
ncbi:MAG: extracellular solute-binding protein [Clostridia bacterium]|nr:extracellular solute-binding protein [Clostridia bacterium]